MLGEERHWVLPAFHSSSSIFGCHVDRLLRVVFTLWLLVTTPTSQSVFFTTHPECLLLIWVTKKGTMLLRGLYRSGSHSTEHQYQRCLQNCNTPVKDIKGYFTSGKMNVYLKWVIYVKEMWNYLWIWRFLDWEKPENVLAFVDERQQLPECTSFTAQGGHAYQ